MPPRSFVLFFIGIKMFLLPEAMSLKILMIQPSYGKIKSHFEFSLNLAKFLAENDGHEVHLLVLIIDENDQISDKNDEKRLNVRYFMPTTPRPAAECDIKIGTPIDMTYFELANSTPLMDELNAEKFDVGISEAFSMTEYSFAIFHFLRIPVTIATSTMPISPHQFYLLGVLSKMASRKVPGSLLKFGKKLNFGVRNSKISGIEIKIYSISLGSPLNNKRPLRCDKKSEENTKISGTMIGDHRDKQLQSRATEIWESYVDQTVQKIKSHIETDKIYQKLAAEKYEMNVFPGLDEILRKTRFFLVNSQPELDFDNYNSVTDIEEVKFIGGFNLAPNTRELDKNISEKLGDKKGIIYVNFGIIVDTTNPEFWHLIEAVIGTIKNFAEFLFVWKMSNDDKIIQKILEELSNVYTIDWINQLGILGNTKTVAFVSHCGMNSVLEGIYNGVPMVCVPFFGDQYYNAESLARQHIGLVVDRNQDKHTVQQQLTVALAKALGHNESAGFEDKIDLDKLNTISSTLRQKNISKFISDAFYVVEDGLGTNDQIKDLSVITDLLRSGAAFGPGWPEFIV